MNRETGDFFEENEVPEVYFRFRKSLLSGTSQYFDVSEFEILIDYLEDEGDFENINTAIRQAVKIHPDSVALRLRFAQSLIASGEPEMALHQLHFLEKIETDDPEIFLLKGTSFLMMNQLSEAETSFKTAIRKAGSDLSEILYQIGTSYIPYGDIHAAVRYFERSYRQNSENEQVLNDLGYFSDQLGFPEKSIRYYNLYLDLDPFNPAVWFNLGIAYNRTSKFEKAIEAYDYALALNSRFYHAMFNKANALANLERFNEAIQAYRLYLKSDPENDDAYTYMGECYLNMGRYRLAERQYRKALLINPRNDMALFSTGVIRWIEKNYAESIRLIRSAIGIEGEISDYWFTCARVLADSGRRNEAIAAFKKASVLDPGNPEIWISYAECLHTSGRVNDAIVTLKKGIRHNNNDAASKYLLAAYLLETNDEKEAALQLETALKLDFNRHSDLFEIYPKAAQNDSVKKLIRTYKPHK